MLLTKKLVVRTLQAEIADHLGHGKNEAIANPPGNTRNGKRKTTLKCDFGVLPIEVSCTAGHFPIHPEM